MPHGSVVVDCWGGDDVVGGASVLGTVVAGTGETPGACLGVVPAAGRVVGVAGSGSRTLAGGVVVPSSVTGRSSWSATPLPGPDSRGRGWPGPGPSSPVSRRPAASRMAPA